jgi:hypothetical protein
MESVFNSWPLAAVICFVTAVVSLQSPLSALIGRIRSVKVGDHSVDASGDVSEQQKRIETTGTTGSVSVPTTHALPPPSEVYAPLEQETRNASAAANLPADVERAWLIRAIAVTRVMRGHEMTYRVITGSQLELMLRANSAAPPNMDRAREMYEATKAAFPDFYKAFSFETWANFPIHSGLLREEASILRITPLGQDFLHYLINNALTNPRYG